MPSVTVVGSINLDLVATCPRLPRPGETLIATGFHRYPGGKGANQALASQRAGAQVTLVAAVGEDDNAEMATALLREGGVDLSAVVVSDQPTGTAMITVDPEGENQIVVVPGANHTLDPSIVDTAGAEVVLCQLEVPLEVVEAAARTATGLFCLNTAPATSLTDEILNRADVLIMNETERDELADQIQGTGALVVVTLGPVGARAYRKGRMVAEASPPAVTPIDTVGAGDAFCGAFVTALGQGRSITTSLTWGCAAGAAATTRPGAQPSLPTVPEIERLLDQ